jgi:hypothetical protein
MNKTSINIDKLHLFLIGVIIVGVVFLFGKNNNTPPFTPSNPYQPQIDSLSLVIKQYEKSNVTLDSIYLELNVKYTKQTELLDSLNLNIEKQRKSYETKIKGINNSSPTELYEFITNRYK